MYYIIYYNSLSNILLVFYVKNIQEFSKNKVNCEQENVKDEIEDLSKQFVCIYID